jgi:hypothetical protein
VEHAHIAPPRCAVTVVEGGDSNRLPCSAEDGKARPNVVSGVTVAKPSHNALAPRWQPSTAT